MAAFALLATSPPLLSAVLAATGPVPPSAGPPSVVPITWSLQAAQEPPPEQGQKDAPASPAGPPAGDQPVGEIVVQGTYGPPAIDPAERINEVTYAASVVIDEVLVEPLAHGYRDVLPEPIRDGLGNVVRTLGEPNNALNFLLQGKIGKAFGALGRLAINATLGVGGLFDVAAKPAFGIPYRRNGWANTLGYYGVGPGPYLYVPITGPTTVRDQIGVTLDQALLPFAFGKPFNRPAYTLSYFAINGLDSRLRDEAELDAIKASDDPYRARRDTYLARRRREIAALKGETVPEDQGAQDAPLAPVSTPPAPTAPEPVQPPKNPEALLITRPR